MNINRMPFDGFEVHLVAELPDTDGSTFCETVDTPAEYENAKEEAIGWLFTVYGHRTWPENSDLTEDGYGTTAITDFVTEPGALQRAHDQALDLAYALAAGRDIVEDCTPGIEL